MARTFLNPVIFPASLTTQPSLRILPGTAPSSPTNGDVWTTATRFNVYLSGSTRELVDTSSGQTISGSKGFTGDIVMGSSAAVLTIASSSANAGLSIPHGSAPSSPSNGDVWTTSAAGMFVRVNGNTRTVSLLEAAQTVTGSRTHTGTITMSAATIICAVSATGRSSIRVGHGVAPSSPFDGDVWTTTAGMYVQVNSSTVGPLAGLSTAQTWTAAQTFSALLTANLGITVTGAKTTAAATVAGYASLNLPHGTAPSSPADGDVWTTTAGIYVRVNGSTVGPLGTSSADMVLASQQTSTGRKIFTETSAATASLIIRATSSSPTSIFQITDNAATYTYLNFDLSSSPTWSFGVGTTTWGSAQLLVGVNPQLTLQAQDSTVGANNRGVGGIILNRTRWNGSISVPESSIIDISSNGSAAGAYRLRIITGGELLLLSGADKPIRVLRGTDSSPTANMLTLETNAEAVLASFNSLAKFVAVTPATTTASINLPHGTAPSSPVNGDAWTTTAGLFARINSVTIGPLGEPIEPFVFGYPGAIAVSTGLSTIYLDASYTLVTARGYLTTAPTGSSAIMVVKKNGSTVNTITITAGTNTGVSTVATTFVAGDIMTVDITQVGSSVTGSDLTANVRLRRTS